MFLVMSLPFPGCIIIILPHSGLQIATHFPLFQISLLTFLPVRTIFYSSWLTSSAISPLLVVTGSLSWPRIFMTFSDVITISGTLPE